MKKLLTVSAIFLFLTINALAEGERINIFLEDRICEKTEDCIGVETDCERGGCECPGAPVNIKFEEKYKKLLEECRRGKLHTICEPVCQAGSIKCVENKCVFVEQSGTS